MVSQQELTSAPAQGTLLGVVVDLSGSMYASMQNTEGNQFSRIESLSRVFQQVLAEVKLFLETSQGEHLPFRLFIHGFGFLCKSEPTWKDSIGDVFSIMSHLNEEIKRYQPLQPEIERLWLDEIEQTLEEKKINEDAKEALRVFVERELREQAVQAEQQRSVARFQRWCLSTCQKIDRYDARLRLRVSQYRKLAVLLLPLIICFLWLLRGPARLLAYLNEVFEAWLQRKLTDLQNNAHTYATQQAEKVAAATKKALAQYYKRVSTVVEEGMIGFLDNEASKFIRLYNTGSSPSQRKQAFDHTSLKQVYEHVSAQISAIMSPHANTAWNKSTFLLKQAAKALKIKPDWNVLKEKTIRCAHQIVWETIAPSIRSQAKTLAQKRFTRAALTAIVQKTKDGETTLSLQEVSTITAPQEVNNLTLRELPIFGNSPLGLALNQTFIRLQREAKLPQNQGLRPVILIISDGIPTDTGYVNSSALAEKIKLAGIPIVCCYVTNRNVGRPWVLRRSAGWFWPEAANLLFSMASSVEEWPQFGQRLTESRFSIKKQVKLFIQVNHSEYLKSFIEAIVLPVERERRMKEEDKVASDEVQRCVTDTIDNGI